MREESERFHFHPGLEQRSIYFLVKKYTSWCLDRLYATAYNRVEGEGRSRSQKIESPFSSKFGASRGIASIFGENAYRQEWGWSRHPEMLAQCGGNLLCVGSKFGI